MSPKDNPKPSPTPKWWRLTGVQIGVSAALASLLAYGWTLNGYFLSEDFANVARFIDFPLRAWPGLFVADWSGGMWERTLPELRPVIALSFILDAQIWGPNAFGFRLQNLLFHAACAGMVGLLAYRITGLHATSGKLAAVLFALHPVQAYSVALDQTVGVGPCTPELDSIVRSFQNAAFHVWLLP